MPLCLLGIIIWGFGQMTSDRWTRGRCSWLLTWSPASSSALSLAGFSQRKWKSRCIYRGSLVKAFYYQRWRLSLYLSYPCGVFRALLILLFGHCSRWYSAAWMSISWQRLFAHGETVKQRCTSMKNHILIRLWADWANFPGSTDTTFYRRAAYFEAPSHAVAV